MAKHTEGTLIVLPTQYDHGKSLCIQTESIGDVLAMIKGPVSDNDRENARRLVACWNTLKDIPTEVLERGDVLVTRLEAPEDSGDGFLTGSIG